MQLNWQIQEIQVDGKPRKLGEVLGGQLYHGTTAELNRGDILQPQEKRNFAHSSSTSVSITSDLDRAKYWAKEVSKINGREIHVYEVLPLSMVEPWRVQPTNFGKNIVLWEGRVQEAKIIQRIL